MPLSKKVPRAASSPLCWPKVYGVAGHYFVKCNNNNNNFNNSNSNNKSQFLAFLANRQHTNMVKCGTQQYFGPTAATAAKVKLKSKKDCFRNLL